MRALVFDQTLQWAERPLPRREGECLIRVKKVGICNTDLEITAGYMGFRGILGHEFVGIVEEGPPEWLDQRVVGEINVGCGDCPACAQKLARHCPHRTVLGILGRDGAMAEYLSLPPQNLLTVPETVRDEEAVFVEPLAAALEILEQLHVRPLDRVCLIGDGKLAVLIARVLAQVGVDLVAVGHHPEKLAKMPARERVLESEFRLAREFDFVIEASGHPSGWQLALGAVRPRGTIVLKSTYAGSFDFNPAPLVIDEIAVVGSRCGSLAPALRQLAAGRIRVADLISATYSFDEALAAFEAARQSKQLKILIDMP